MSLQQRGVYHISTVAQQYSATLLPENLASLVTAIAIATRLSLRCSALFWEVLLEAAKYGTSAGFGLSRQALISAVSAAKGIHMKRIGNGNETAISDASSDSFLGILDRYTNVGIYVIHHTFTLAELFAMSGFQITSQTVQTGFRTAEESVSIIDGIFGSNETSRALAALVSLIRREITQDDDFKIGKLGKLTVIASLTKALTAFAILQNVTQNRMQDMLNMEVIWEGVVIEEETDQASSAQYEQRTSGLEMEADSIGDDPTDQQADILMELEKALGAASPNEDDHCHDARTHRQSAESIKRIPAHYVHNSMQYEIENTTKTTTVRTMTIRPLHPKVDRATSSTETGRRRIASSGEEYGPPLRSPQTPIKTIVVKEDGEQQETFLATLVGRDGDDAMDIYVNEQNCGENDGEPESLSMRHLRSASEDKALRRDKGGLRFMLATVSRKLQKKKLERTEYMNTDNGMNDMSLRDNPLAELRRHRRSSSSTTRTTSMTTITSMTQLSSAASNDSPKGPISRAFGNQSQYTATRTEPSTKVQSFSFLDQPYEDEKSKALADQSKKKQKLSWKLKLGNKPKRPTILPNAQRGGKPGWEDEEDKQVVRLPSFNPDYMQGSDGGQAKVLTSMHLAPSRSSQLHGRKRGNSLTSLTSVQSIARLSTTTTYTNTEDNHRRHAHSTEAMQQLSNPRNFPQSHLLINISRFMRYASAAYGESFMRILGIGKIPIVLPRSRHHHSNHHAFSHHTGVDVEDILLSSYTDQSFLTVNNPHVRALVHYVTVDHSAKAIVLTCRGTLGLNDILTDLTCEYADFALPCDEDVPTPRVFRAHAGMLGSAQLLAGRTGKVFQTIQSALRLHPQYGLVLCGHSLGAGVASLLSVLWSEQNFGRVGPCFVTSSASGLPAGRPIHCYTYGPPCVASLELSKYCAQGLVTSVVHAYDVVSSLSLGLLKDFKNVATSLYEDERVSEEIISKIMGKFQHMWGGKTPEPSATETSDTNRPIPADNDEEQWFWALIKTMRADMRAEKLYPPGTIYHIECIPKLSVISRQDQVTTYAKATQASQHMKQAHKVIFRRCDDVEARFSEIIFAKTMFTDHSPNLYENAVLRLCKGILGAEVDQ